MRLGDLIELLDEVARAKQDVADAETAILHGGNADTMARKHAAHRGREEYLEYLLNQEIDLREGT